MTLQQALAMDGLITGLASLFFALIVIYKNRRNIINITLSLLSIVTAIWSLGYWQWLLVTENSSSALFWLRILTIGSLFIPVFYYHWIISLLEENQKKINKTILFFSYFCAISINLLSALSPFLIEGVRPVKNLFIFWPIAGKLYTFYILFIYAGLVLYSIFLLLKKQAVTVGRKRLQIRYVLLGSILGFGGGATNFFLWYNLPFTILPLGNFLVILYPFLFTYAIVKHQLMDIRLVLRKTSVHFASIGAVIILVITIKYGIVDTLSVNSGLWGDLLILILGIIFYPIIRNAAYKLANKYFFTSLYDGNKVVAEISDILASTLEIEKIYEKIHNRLKKVFHFDSFGIAIIDDKDKHFYLDFNQNLNIQKLREYPRVNFLKKINFKNKRTLVLEELKYNKKEKSSKTIQDFMNKIGAEVIVPLDAKGETVGAMILGSKSSKDMYNHEDISTLEIISVQAAISIENAKLYEEVKNFNIKLKKEIDKATSDLKMTNRELKEVNQKLAEAYEKLKKLDRAKSEFLSIASHQLRTPLTSIKGFTSLLMEGAYGKQTKETNTTLEKIYVSNERLIKLVEDLLNISRIESGKIAFEFKEGQIEELAEEVVESMQLSAKNKKLKLTYQPPKEKIESIKFDKSKLREVISNLIDNAIKYTKKGTISLSVKDFQTKVQLIISDTGVGIAEGEADYIFEKFQRGKDINRIHTEGVGLGLFVCKKMVDAHEGKIWAESDGLGKGSRFIVELKKIFNHQKESTVKELNPAKEK